MKLVLALITVASLAASSGAQAALEKSVSSRLAGDGQIAAIESESPWKSYTLGRSYATGDRVAMDVQKARFYYEQALASSDPAVARAAAFALGQLAQKQLQDAEAAAGYYKKGADLGDEWSSLSLAALQATGGGIPKDVNSAKNLYEKALASTDKTIATSAALALGKLALGELHDPKLAASYFEKGAELGDAWAMFSLAQIYGSGTSAQRIKASELYRNAVEHNSELAKTAYYALGGLYLEPPLREVTRALMYYARAAQFGDPWASYVIAQVYDGGKGIKRNSKKAKEYYLLGLKSGDTSVAAASAFALGQLHLKKPLRNYKLTAEYFKSGSKLGNDWSKFALAQMYASGKGVTRSATKAKSLLLELQAAKDSSISMTASFELGRLHMSGPLKNYRMARRYFRSGTKKGSLWSSYYLAELYAAGRGGKHDRGQARALLTRLRHSDDPQIRLAAQSLLRRLHG
jgi:TPR repeat protein